LFIQARLGVKMPLASRRSISTTTSPASPSRRCTLPSVDVNDVPLTLDGRRRNLSDTQLHAVPNALRRYLLSSPSHSGQQHVGLQRKLTAPDLSNLRRSPHSGIIQFRSVQIRILISLKLILILIFNHGSSNLGYHELAALSIRSTEHRFLTFS